MNFLQVNQLGSAELKFVAAPSASAVDGPEQMRRSSHMQDQSYRQFARHILRVCVATKFGPIVCRPRTESRFAINPPFPPDNHMFIYIYIYTYMQLHRLQAPYKGALQKHKDLCRHTCVHMYVYIYTYACMYTYIDTYLYVCICMYVRTYVGMYVCMCVCMLKYISQFLT